MQIVNFSRIKSLAPSQVRKYVDVFNILHWEVRVANDQHISHNVEISHELIPEPVYL